MRLRRGLKSPLSRPSEVMRMRRWLYRLMIRRVLPWMRRKWPLMMRARWLEEGEEGDD